MFTESLSSFRSLCSVDPSPPSSPGAVAAALQLLLRIIKIKLEIKLEIFDNVVVFENDLMD